MKEYKKPVTYNYKVGKNIVPVALTSAAAAGLSVGTAFAIGVAKGLGDIQVANNRCNTIKKVIAF